MMLYHQNQTTWAQNIYFYMRIIYMNYLSINNYENKYVNYYLRNLGRKRIFISVSFFNTYLVNNGISKEAFQKRILKC